MLVQLFSVRLGDFLQLTLLFMSSPYPPLLFSISRSHSLYLVTVLDLVKSHRKRGGTTLLPAQSPSTSFLGIFFEASASNISIQTSYTFISSNQLLDILLAKLLARKHKVLEYFRFLI
ncbi:hypothetical protein ABFS82_06G129600 [Erythranthe guttata]